MVFNIPGTLVKQALQVYSSFELKKLETQTYQGIDILLQTLSEEKAHLIGNIPLLQIYLFV